MNVFLPRHTFSFNTFCARNEGFTVLYVFEFLLCVISLLDDIASIQLKALP